VYYDLISHIRNLPKQGEIIRENTKQHSWKREKMNAKEESIAPKFEKEINRKRRDLSLGTVFIRFPSRFEF
jgi:hypothetical protein